MPPPILAERYPLALAAAVFETLLLLLAGGVAYALRFNWEIPSNPYIVAIFAQALTVVTVQALMGCYQSWRGVNFLHQLGRLYTAWLLAVGILAGVSVLLHVSAIYSRIWFVASVGLGCFALTAFRLLLFWVLRAARASGKNLKGVVVVQIGQAGQRIHERSELLLQHGYQVVSTINLGDATDWDRDLVARIGQTRAHELWLCLPLEEGARIRQIVHVVRNLLIDVRYFPDWGDMPLLSRQVGEVAGMVTLDVNRSPMIGPMRWIKRAEDLFLGSILSLAIVPVCLLIAVAIKLDSRGPVLFKQYRTGINGRRFKVYKFRSMTLHDEEDGGVTQAYQGDPRITRIGAFLRRTSLDELPQFYNVLQGRMSIVGPRPHALAHNDYYKNLVESYMQRHKVKPGITGWAQVNGYRGETNTLEKMEKRVEHDLWYIDHWSLGLDLKIIVMTIFKGFINQQP